MPYRRAVDETARGACKLSRTILSLLIVGPSTTPASLNNLEPFDLSTAVIAVHKGCYTALVLT